MHKVAIPSRQPLVELKSQCSLRSTILLVGFLATMTNTVGPARAQERKITHVVTNGVMRQWADVAGKHTTKGRLIGYGSAYVCLLKENGRQTTVPIVRLRTTDRQHIQELVASKQHVQPIHVYVSSTRQPSSLSTQPKARPVVMTRDTIRVRVASSVIRNFLQRSESSTQQVDDVIVGYPVSGVAQTNTNIASHLVPSRDSIKIAIPISGKITANVVSHADVVRVHTRTSGKFAKQMLLTLTPDFVDITPQPTYINVHSKILNVVTHLPRLRGRFARRIGGRRAEEKRPQAEMETAMKNRERIDASTQRRIDGMLDRVSTFVNSLDETLKDIQDDYVRRTQMSTTSDFVHVRIRQDLDQEEADKWVEPPVVSAPVVIQVHQLAIQNMMDDLGELDDPEAFAKRLTSRQGPAAQRLRTLVENGRQEAKWSDDEQWFVITWYP